MCGYHGQRFIFLPLLCLLFARAFSQTVPVPLSALEEIRREAALIRRESGALKALLNLSERESADLRKRLAAVEAALTKAEALLETASLNLERSEAALLPLREDLAKLGNELAALKLQAAESNRRLEQSRKTARFWMAAAISAAAVFAAVETGRELVK